MTSKPTHAQKKKKKRGETLPWNKFIVVVIHTTVHRFVRISPQEAASHSTNQRRYHKLYICDSTTPNTLQGERQSSLSSNRCPIQNSPYSWPSYSSTRRPTPCSVNTPDMHTFFFLFSENAAQFVSANHATGRPRHDALNSHGYCSFDLVDPSGRGGKLRREEKIVENSYHYVESYPDECIRRLKTELKHRAVSVGVNRMQKLIGRIGIITPLSNNSYMSWGLIDRPTTCASLKFFLNRLKSSSMYWTAPSLA